MLLILIFIPEGRVCFYSTYFGVSEQVIQIITMLWVAWGERGGGMPHPPKPPSISQCIVLLAQTIAYRYAGLDYDDPREEQMDGSRRKMAFLHPELQILQSFNVFH